MKKDNILMTSLNLDKFIVRGKYIIPVVIDNKVMLILGKKKKMVYLSR